MLHKFSILPPKSQYQTVDDVSSKVPAKDDESMNSSISTDRRDDSTCEIISTAGKQFIVTSAETRQGLDEVIAHPSSPVDCHNFPEVEFRTADLLPPPPKRSSTNGETEGAGKDSTLPAEGFEAEWPNPGLTPPSPASALKIVNEAETEATVDMTSSEHTSFDVISPHQDGSFFLGTPNRSTVNKTDSSFVESVGNVTMDEFGFPLVETGTLDAFGFPLVEASTPRANKSMRAVPVCPRDSPVKLMRSVRSDPALNRLTIRSYIQARHREPEAVDKEQFHSVQLQKPEQLALAHLQARYKKPEAAKGEGNDSTKQVSAPSVFPEEAELSSEAIPNEVQAEFVEDKIKNAVSVLSKAKSTVTDDDVDEMLSAIVDPNKSCDDANQDFTSPATAKTVLIPKVLPSGSLQPLMTVDGSFEAQESSIEVLDSSGEVPAPTQFGKDHKRRKRIPSSKLRCTDEAMQCNINFQEMEKAMWAFMDEFDERAGKFGYIVGCIERVPREVNMSVNEMSFSLLGDEDNIMGKLANDPSVSMLDDEENIVGKLVTDPSVSMLDSLTLDD